jgi:hypothetical protein
MEEGSGRNILKYHVRLPRVDAEERQGQKTGILADDNATGTQKQKEQPLPMRMTMKTMNPLFQRKQSESCGNWGTLSP